MTWAAMIAGEFGCNNQNLDMFKWSDENSDCLFFNWAETDSHAKILNLNWENPNLATFKFFSFQGPWKKQQVVHNLSLMK